MTILRNPPIVEPEEFKTAFQKAINNSSAEAKLTEAWNTPTLYTIIWQDLVYSQLAYELRLQYCPKYWSLDAVFFRDSEKMLSKKPYSNYAQFLSVAMEHANDSTTSHEEMNKLSIFNASLKVLVTYPKQHYDNQQKKASKLLEYYAKQARDADEFDLFAKKQRQMVIFGFKNGEHIDWKYYLFNGESFDEC